MIGEKVDIKSNIDSPYAGEWGIIKYYDGEFYHIAIWNDPNVSMIFDRKEFRTVGDQLKSLPKPQLSAEARKAEKLAIKALRNL